MSSFAFPCWAVYQVLENRLALVEMLNYPEVSRLGANRDRLRAHIRRKVRRLLEPVPLSTLFRRHVACPPVVSTVSLMLDPAPVNVAWREALPLSFSVIRWRQGEAELAFVPALAIAVLAPKPEELEDRLPHEIRAALSRAQAAQALSPLVRLQRATRVYVESLSVEIKLRSPKARAVAAERESEQAPSMLKRVATDLTLAPAEPIYGLDSILDQLAELWTARRPRSVLFIGPSGVGKSAAVRELARRRNEFNLGATPFWTTSGSRLVAGMSGFGMWQERCHKVVREASRRRAIVHLGNLVELMEVGKSEHNRMSIAGFLRPALARGDLLAAAECTPEQLPIIEREDPHLLDVFHRVTISEPDVEQGRAILAHCAANAPPNLRRTLAADTLDTLDRLHRRYATYSAYPGRPLRFLNNLLHDHAKDPEIRPAAVYAAFARETGLPTVLIDPAQKLDPERTALWFGERVLGQPEAIALIVDLLATTKAGLTRPRKPIASLLFIGPTGVGKTEMAKTLAEFLFGSRQRLTRFDMSEYGDPVAVQRLVGGVFGSEGLLTAKVREQPFSVLLLDEFEKAHPLFLDLLLQMLGEGRLTDAAGRLADFRNSVVILTSNLGADTFQQGAFGFAGSDGPRDAAREHFVRAVEAYVRHELFNRLDRLVPFAPLDAPAVQAIAERHLQRLEARDGVRYRGVTLHFGDGVTEHLARNGFDARYGARPLLRTVERELLAPLADQMNRYSAETPVAVDVRLAQSALRVRVKPRTDESGRALQVGAAAPLADAVTQGVELRRQVQALERSTCVRELNNEIVTLERERKRFEKAQMRYVARMARRAQTPDAWWKPAGVAPARQSVAQQTRLARLGEVADRLHALAVKSNALEDDALQSLYAAAGAAMFAPGDLAIAMEPLRKELDELLMTFYCRQFTASDRITLALFSEEPEWLVELAGAYLGIFRQLLHRVEMVAYRVFKAGKTLSQSPTARDAGEADEAPRFFWREDVLIAAATAREPERAVLARGFQPKPDDYLAEPPPKLLGLAFHLRGLAAAPRFTPEQGLHIYKDNRQPQPRQCLVE
ncbi:MAG TPA: AAA family ATPase, partial [Gemmataceae bacterium]